ncbi:alpha/beta fold hydrolase [Streptomyces sp. SPB074]|uniref:alpha/beta fold hydrolase n=1 Tax=Streptomyces sp. (strain SPB074) TaxID=465543 RepID=UPI00017F1021|nr:alpha/beta hydrolase [Streptomyces sp. SPB074]EDY42878.1 alpha/beta hydrolase [Streptomyces sp. SPB074]
MTPPQLVPPPVALAHDASGPASTPGGPLPLVLLHGTPFDRTLWAPLRARAAASRRVLVPDLRGYGESEVTPGTVGFATFAADIAHLLDAHGIGDFALGGLSMGGQIAMECVRHFGTRVRGLLLVGTTPEPETPEGVRARRELAARLEREGMDPYTAEALPRMTATPPGSAVTAHVRRMMRGTPPAGAAAALRGRALRPDYRPVLREFTAPALVVVGERDTYTPVASARALADLLPDARLAVVPGAAHLPVLEAPERVGELVVEWLERVEGAGT